MQEEEEHDAEPKGAPNRTKREIDDDYVQYLRCMKRPYHSNLIMKCIKTV